jgi:hypothetical protein
LPTLATNSRLGRYQHAYMVLKQMGHSQLLDSKRPHMSSASDEAEEVAERGSMGQLTNRLSLKVAHIPERYHVQVIKKNIVELRKDPGVFNDLMNNGEPS